MPAQNLRIDGNLESFLELFDDLREPRIAAQTIPLRTKQLAVGGAVRNFGHLFEQVDRTIGLAGAHQDFGSHERIRWPLHCVLGFWYQFDRLLAFQQRIFHLAEITMNQSEVRDLHRMITRPLVQSFRPYFRLKLCEEGV